MADRQNEYSRNEPHLGMQGATGIGATLVASSEDDAALGRTHAASKIGPGALPLERPVPPAATRWDTVFGKRRSARRLTRPQPAEGPRGVLEQASEAGRDAAIQIADEFREAAESFANERKNRAADAVRGVADALNHAAGDLARESPPIAEYASLAASRVQNFADQLHDRSWGLIIAEAETVARRQPALFLLGAAGIGFALGRLMLASPRRAEPVLDPNAPGSSDGAASATLATGAAMRPETL